MFQGSFREFSSVFQGSFKGVSTKISDISSSFKRGSRVFERSLKVCKGVSMMFKGCSRKFQKKF